jgi:phosphoglycolate phosphatase
MKRRFIVFDLDGTLIDSLPDIAAAVNGSLAEIGAEPLPLATIRSMVGDGSPVLVGRALALRGIAADRLTDRLARFADGKTLGLCTNKLQSTALAVLRGLGLETFFAAVRGGDTVPAHKPDPRHPLAVLAALGGSPAEAVMVGDNEHDITAGRGAGMGTVLVRYGYARRPFAEIPADRQIDSFAELPGALALLDAT